MKTESKNHLWHDFWVAAFKVEREEGVDEDAHKLDHLETGEVPEQYYNLKICLFLTVLFASKFDHMETTDNRN